MSIILNLMMTEMRVNAVNKRMGIGGDEGHDSANRKESKLDGKQSYNQLGLVIHNLLLGTVTILTSRRSSSSSICR